ncbi:hypothetical protein [Paenibacillus wynnii]|uniref:Uncharacterized protein n=1 Tax=Paenibacillus wynnii TaxID=268407 RepID=A0A098M2I1_9BACL|nr:hypothetical protein [Paenibacillus wynnii]KGE16530.1 hypothetical protein PWYN_17540 [Paenibacillus wynnii]
MKRKDRWRNSAGKKACFFLLISIGLATASFSFPVPLAATGNSVTAYKNATPDLNMTTAPAPGTLKDFVQLHIDKLAEEATFKDWKGAQSEYYPLGPGTHSWLVNVMKGKQRIGYLIITAKNEGGYMLSEYGAGYEGLPYSLKELRQLLVQEGLITSTTSGNLTLTPLYAPLLPLWEVSISGKKLFINAAVPEVLPWNSSKAEALLKKAVTAANHGLTGESNLSPREVYQTNQSSDPYDNLLWLTNPKLPMTSDNDFSALLKRKGNLVFQSAGQNESVGAPLMITGYQIWTAEPQTEGSGTGSINKLYTAIGPQGRRFVPLSLLQQYGTLHQVSTTSN